MASTKVALDLSEIVLNSDGMRNCRTELEDIKELAEDIQAEGRLLNDLGVWQPPGKDYYVLNYGYRRHAALLWLKDNNPQALAALGKLECKVFGGSLAEALSRNLKENLKRKNVNRADVIERVHYLHDCADTKMTETEIAKAIGKPQSDVSAMLGIALGCVKEVITALRKGLINYSDAKKLSKFALADQPGMLEQLLDPEQALALKKMMTKQVEGSLRPGLKTLRETVLKLEQTKVETDAEYRNGVIIGLKFALGLVQPEYLEAPPHAIPADYAEQVQKLPRTVRAEKPNKKVFLPTTQEKVNDEA